VHGFETTFSKESALPEREDNELDESGREGKMGIMAKRRNAIAMVCFTMAFLREGMLMILYQAVTPEWPSGLAYRVIEILIRKFGPVDMISKIELRTELNNISMKKKDKLSDLFEKIASVKNRFNCGNSMISDDELMAVVIGAAPVEYQGSLLNEQLNKGNRVKLDDLREVMECLHWQLHGSRFISEVEGGNEVILTTFVGTCFTCKKKVHKASACPKKGRMKNEKKLSTESCGHCGKKGHVYANCWLKPENIDKAPQWVRKKAEKKEIAAAATSVNMGQGNNLEVMLCQLSFNKDINILRDPNFFIADSGASSHSTGSMLGMLSFSENDKSTGIMMPNGNIMKPSMTGCLPVQVCKTYAEELYSATLVDVSIVP
jgi:hypothetical protein